MFSLLSPLSLWLGALLAIPLVIHFLGRQRLRKEPFPSLLLVEERFAKSMQRHRLKNLLLLLIRTLLILCLLLALANPPWNGIRAVPAAGAGSRGWRLIAQRRLRPPARGGGPGPPRAGQTAEGRLWMRTNGAGSGRWTRSWAARAGRPAPRRRGGPAEAAAALRGLRRGGGAAAGRPGPQGATAHAYLPVYAWEDLFPARQILLEALKERPGLRVVLWDFGAEGPPLRLRRVQVPAFGAPRP